jgi:hypothetical protein
LRFAKCSIVRRIARDEANAAPSILWWSIVVLQKNGKVASQPILDLVTANGACHD